MEDAALVASSQHVQVLGRLSRLVCATNDAEGRPCQTHGTVFLQLPHLQGVRGRSFVTSAAHLDNDPTFTVGAVRRTLPTGACAVQGRTNQLHGPPVAPAVRARAEPRGLPALRRRTVAP
jgi:glutamate-1-semialdehyde 2,1-aminomutase